MAREDILSIDGQQVVITAEMAVRCSGGSDTLGHPMEFITLERGEEARCNYCGCLFVHTSHPEAAAMRARAKPYDPFAVAPRPEGGPGREAITEQV